MNDWDNQDSFPPEDDDESFNWLDDDSDFDWLSESVEDDEDEPAPDEWEMPRPARAEREFADQLEAAEDADFGNTDELLDWMADPEDDADDDDDTLDWLPEPETDDAPAPDPDPVDAGGEVPDWLQGMDLPEASDEAIAAAQEDVLGSSADDDFGDFFMDEGDDAGDLWGSSFGDDDDSSDDSSATTGDPWGATFGAGDDADDDDADDFLSAFGSPDEEADDEAMPWGATLDDSSAADDGIDFDDLLNLSGADEDTDQFLVGASAEDDDSVDDFLTGSSSAADDDVDFDDLLNLSGADEDTDQFLVGAGNDDDDDVDALFAGLTDDSADDDLFGAERGDSGDSLWGDLDEDDQPAAETSDAAGASLWGDLGDLTDDSAGETIWENTAMEEDVTSADDTPADFFDAMFDEEEPDAADAVPDWVDATASAESDDLNDLLADLDGDDDSGDLDDLLASLGDDDDDDSDDLDDLLASLDTEEEADAAGSLDDLIAGLDTGSSETGGLEDLFGSFDADADEMPEAIVDEDPVAADDLSFFDEMSDEDPIAADDLSFLDEMSDEDPVAVEDLSFLDEMSDEDPVAADDLSFLDEVSDEDPIAATEDDFSQAEGAADLEFLAALDSDDDAMDWFDDESEADAVSAEGDWLAALDDAAIASAAEEPAAEAGVDLDALLASFEDGGAAFTEDGELDTTATDLDSLFDSLDEEQRAALPDDIRPDELPDWLQEIASGQDRESAAAIIRQRRDRSLDDLDDRLLELRERGLELGTDSAAVAGISAASSVLPNADDALAPANIQRSDVQAATDPVFTPDQLERARILETLAASSDVATTAGQSQRRFALPAGLDRVVITLILLAAVLAPFSLPEFDNVAVLPPMRFGDDTTELAAFNLIEGLAPNDPVLFAAEYGATGARELDTATRAFFEHMLASGVKPVIVSTDAIGLLRAENTIVELAGESGRNQSFVVGGFIPGGSLGLRDFRDNLSTTLSADLRGNPTGLRLTDLDDFKAIVLVAESGDTVRGWMEQIVPLTDSPIILFTGQAARPLAQPYADSIDQVVTLMTGYDDAYTYQQMALAVYNPTSTPTPTATNTPTPTLTPTNTSTPTPTNTPTNTPTPTDTLTPSPSPIPSDTPEPTPTQEEPTPTREEPTPTREMPSPTPTLIPDIEVGTIVASQRINVRAGAGSNFDVVAALDPGQRVRVLERSADLEWVQVELPDGVTGWVAAFLIDIETIPETEFENDGASRPALRVYAKRVREIAQATDVAPTEDLVTIARNVSGLEINVFDNPALIDDPIATLRPNAEVFVLQAGNTATQILLTDGREGFVETRLMRLTEVARDEIPFAPTASHTPTSTLTPTQTFTPTLTFTPTVTGTATNTPLPSPTPFEAVVTPSPPQAPVQRSGSTAVGLVAAISIIGLGNAYWIFLWMRRRES